MYAIRSYYVPTSDAWPDTTRAMTSPVQPFRISIPESSIADLKERLARTRWPDEPPLEPWTTGTSVAYAQSLCEDWRSRFDWRAWEARLNAFPQFKALV